MKRWVLVALAIVALAAFIAFALRSSGSEPEPIVSEKGMPTLDERSPPHGRTVQSLNAPSTAFSGMVLTTQGTPIGGARVCAACVNCPATDLVEPFCGESEPDGTFNVEVAPAGYFVAAFAEGFRPAQVDDGRAIFLAEGQNRTVRLVLESGGAVISGTVFDATGGVVPQARVQIARTLRPRAVVGVLCDDQGRFTSSVLPGQVLLTADAPGYARANVLWTAPGRDVRLVLTPGAIARGVVLTTDTRERVSGVQVYAVRLGGWASPDQPRAVSKSDGTFTIEGLEPGTYDFVAFGDSARGRSLQPVEVGLAETVESIQVFVEHAARVAGRVAFGTTGEPCRRGFVQLGSVSGGGNPGAERRIAMIEPDGTVEFGGVAVGRYAVSVQCENSVAKDGPTDIEVGREDRTDLLWHVEVGLALHVSVLDAAGDPVPNAPLVLQFPPRDGIAVPVMPLRADDAGQCEVPSALSPGTYKVMPGAGLSGDPVAVDLRDGMGRVDVVLRLRGRAWLRVSARSPMGDPIDGMRITASRVDTEHFEAPRGEPPDGPAGAMPAPGTLPVAYEGTQAEVLHAVPKGDGLYRIGPVEPGHYQVQAEDDMNPPARARSTNAHVVHVTEGTTDVALVLDRSEVIRGKVLDSAGGPVPNVRISARHQSSRTGAGGAISLLGSTARGAGRSVVTDVDGGFVVLGIQPDARYAVTAEDVFGSAAVQRDVSPGSVVTITLPDPGALSGSVQASDGRPPEALAVRVADLQTGRTRTARVLKDGSWTLNRVAPGKLEVTAVDEIGRTARRDVDLAPGETLNGLHLWLALLDHAAGGAGGLSE